MSEHASPFVFPTWRRFWESLDGVPELLAAANSALQRRVNGNHQLPLWCPTSPEDESIPIAVYAARKWAQGEPPRELEMRPQIAARIHTALDPLLRSIAWPRWLLLEEAFLDASEAGDLLFAALVLRTMCEELVRLHALDLDSHNLARLAASDKNSDQDRAKVFCSAAWSSLAHLSRETIEDASEWPSFRQMESTMSSLKSVRQSLNRYVHPNYGSHIAAIYPERLTAAQVLLSAVTEVYTTFFSLSWAEQRIAGATFDLDFQSTVSASESAEILLKQVIPELQQCERNIDAGTAASYDYLAEWLTDGRDDLAEILHAPGTTDTVNSLLRRSNGSEPEDYQMWDGAKALDILSLASARRHEQHLAEDFPSGAPQLSDQINWLRFSAASLQLAALIDRIKAAAFKVQLVRQIARGNPLGIMLCVRSLIEHRALIAWLPQKVSVSLDKVAKDLGAIAHLPQSAMDVDGALAKFLTLGETGSSEILQPWVLDENGNRRSVLQIGVSKVVEATFSQTDRFRKLYAISSAVMHGRAYRGLELLVQRQTEVQDARQIGLLVLDRICNRDEEMDHIAEVARQSRRLENAADFGGTTATMSNTIAREAFGLLDPAGLNYSGEGTKQSPFCFGGHIEFYAASYALMEQLGVKVEPHSRFVGYDANGRLCDRWVASGREYWILIPQSK